jgi:lipoprotein-anchoring transpeptidase ErfK/SrfK
MKAELRPQVVPFKDQAPGAIVVDVDRRFLYHVQENGTAKRYGVGVGRQGFAWKGDAFVGRKAKWPGWAPTSAMVKLKPELVRYAGGLSGGVANPLGARALYLYQEDRDILFRIHGTNEPWTIGQQVSSGCIRMLNEDILELYNKVSIGTAVLVRRNGHRLA